MPTFLFSNLQWSSGRLRAEFPELLVCCSSLPPELVLNSLRGSQHPPAPLHHHPHPIDINIMLFLSSDSVYSLRQSRRNIYTYQFVAPSKALFPACRSKINMSFMAEPKKKVHVQICAFVSL